MVLLGLWGGSHLHHWSGHDGEGGEGGHIPCLGPPCGKGCDMPGATDSRRGINSQKKLTGGGGVVVPDLWVVSRSVCKGSRHF